MKTKSELHQNRIGSETKKFRIWHTGSDFKKKKIVMAVLKGRRQSINQSLDCLSTWIRRVSRLLTGSVKMSAKNNVKIR